MRRAAQLGLVVALVLLGAAGLAEATTVEGGLTVLSLGRVEYLMEDLFPGRVVMLEEVSGVEFRFVDPAARLRDVEMRMLQADPWQTGMSLMLGSKSVSVRAVEGLVTYQVDVGTFVERVFPVGGIGADELQVHALAMFFRGQVAGSGGLEVALMRVSLRDGAEAGVPVTGVKNVIPEPLTLCGVVLGIGVLGGYCRRRRRGFSSAA